MAIVTGNPIGLLLTLTYTVTATGAVKILPLKGAVMAKSTAVSITPVSGKVAA